jgi:hypothetical protein
MKVRQWTAEYNGAAYLNAQALQKVEYKVWGPNSAHYGVLKEGLYLSTGEPGLEFYEDLKTEIERRKVRERLDIQTRAQAFYIATFDGSNEPFHPAPYYNGAGWNRHKYWLVYTPYPVNNTGLYVDRWECPSLCYSDDGSDWYAYPGCPNPLVDLTPTQIARLDYYSDPCVVMNGTTMEVWYRLTNGANTAETDVYRITTTNLTSWTAPQKVLDSQNANNGIGGVGASFRSQQVFYDGSKYISIFGSTKDNLLYRAETADPASGVWTGLTRLMFAGQPAGMNIWHVGVARDGGTWHMTAYDSFLTQVQYLTSTDGVNFDFVATLLSASNGQFVTHKALYQTVPVKTELEWLVFSSGTFTDSLSPAHTKNGLCLYGGPSIDNIVPVQKLEIRGDSKSKGIEVNEQRTNATSAAVISVKGVRRLIINAGSAVVITNLINAVDGQEVFVVNALDYGEITIKHLAGGAGQIRTRSSIDLVLTQYTGQGLININGTWYQS